MTDKELNTAILNELYKIADDVWPLMRRYDVVGSFTAREINSSKHMGNDMFFEREDANNLHHVEVGNFRCAFPTNQIFDLVAKFELLVGVGSKRHLFVAENKGEVEASVTFAVTKELGELCDFTDPKRWNPAYAFIFIDAERKCLVATNGYSMKVCPVAFSKIKGDTSGMRIWAADFKKMCAKMKGKNVYKMTATKERMDYDVCTNIMFEGIAARAKHECVLVKWYSVCVERSSELCVNVPNWKTICKLVKMGKGENIVVCGKRGDNTIQFKAGDCEAQVEAGKELKHSFCLLFDAERFGIIKKAESMCLYLGTEDSKYVEAVDNNGNVYVLCPKVEENQTFVGEHVDDVLVAPNVECDINVLERYVLNAKRTTKVASSKDSTAKKTVAKKVDKPTTVKQVDPSRKFTFAAIGVKSGDKLTFVDGKEVVAVDDNKVSFEGNTYTLSGFCKTFMPEEKRNKSNSYRGCAFFYKDGVKLEKLFNNALKVKEQSTEAVANEKPQVNVCKETAEQVVNVCAETERAKPTVNVCAEENHTEKPCIVRSVPLSVLQPINYPLLILGRCGVACHTNVQNKRMPASSGRSTQNVLRHSSGQKDTNRLKTFRHRKLLHVRTEWHNREGWNENKLLHSAYTY